MLHARTALLASKLKTSNNTNLSRVSSPANWSMYYTLETQWLHASLTGHEGMQKRNIVLRPLSSRLCPLDMQDEIVISMSIEPLDGLFSILPAIRIYPVRPWSLLEEAHKSPFLYRGPTHFIDDQSFASRVLTWKAASWASPGQV